MYIRAIVAGTFGVIVSKVTGFDVENWQWWVFVAPLIAILVITKK